METKRNLILELTKQFALSTIEYTEELEKLNKYVISNQLLKSGTSIGANVWES
jgi:four helix bundle protein